MSPEGRKFGVKKPAAAAGKKSPGSGSITPPTKKKFGVKNPVPRGESTESGAVGSCVVNCPGEWVNGMWIHSQWCKWGAVLWKGHDKTAADWNCPFGCVPIELASGWTHPWQCVFWDETNRTPFDHNAPKPQEKAETFFDNLTLDDDNDDLPF